MTIFLTLCNVAIPALLRDNQDELGNHPFLSKETLAIYHRVSKFASKNTSEPACLISISPGSDRTIIGLHWETT
jgi:hypothetical protein